MTPEAWQQIEQIFHTALNHPPGEREVYLEAMCAGDSALRRNVESLLAAHEEASGFIERPALEVAAETMAAEPPLAPGRILTHFRVLSRLSRGGMGVVYLAEDINLGRKVALKLLPPEFAQDKERLRRFEQEARATSALNHPNIVTVYEISEFEAGHAIVMELIEGRTLPSRAAEPVPLESLVHWGKQIAGALAAAHAAGIVHRDIKPENIMVRDDGYVKVLDFGLARLTRGQQNAFDARALTLTGPRMVAGTVGYMSPEQARGEPVSSPTDIFSLGIILYQLATGKHPFSLKESKEGGSNDSSINWQLAALHATISQIPLPPSRLNPQVPAALENLILRMLEKEPSRRPAAVEVGKVLGEIAAPSKESQKHRRRTLLLAWGPIAASLLVGSILYYRHEPSQVAPVMLAAVPLTSEQGYEKWPSFSPDGNRVAYAWDGNKLYNEDIYVRNVSGGAPVRITSTKDADSAPAWSPDGRLIAFLRRPLIDKTRLELVVIPPTPGPETKLATLRFTESLTFIPRVTWTPDSQYVVFPDASGREPSSALYLQSVTTGKRSRLTDPPAGTNGDSSPALSPDGRSLAFIRSAPGDQTQLCVLPLSRDYQPGNVVKRLASEHRLIKDPAWTADGKDLVFFAATATKTQSLWRVAASDSSPAVLLPTTGENGGHPAISLKGNRLAYKVADTDQDIWRADFSPQGRHISSQPVIESTKDDIMPRYSPDGSRIAFLSHRSGAGEIWICSSDGSNPVQLTAFKGYAVNPSWFPDGQRIAFASNKDGQFEIYAMGIGGDSSRRLSSDPAHDVFPSVSRDGRTVYFSSNRSGRSEIWRMPVDGSQEAAQLTRGGGVAPSDSADGKFVLYGKEEGNHSYVWRVPAEGGEETMVVGPVRNNNFDVTEDGIYFISSPKSGPQALQFFSFKTQKVSEVAPLKGLVQIGISVSPDGRSVLYSSRTRGDSDLMLVENFR